MDVAISNVASVVGTEKLEVPDHTEIALAEVASSPDAGFTTDDLKSATSLKVAIQAEWSSWSSGQTAEAVKCIDLLMLLRFVQARPEKCGSAEKALDMFRGAMLRANHAIR